MQQILCSNQYSWIFIAAAVLFFMTALGLLVIRKPFNNERNYAILVLGLSIGLFVTLSVSFYHFTVDDVYISLRYARNFANGYGLVFNTDGSPPIEGYTNFLWVIIETVLFLLNQSDIFVLNAIKIIGIIFGVGVLITTYFLIRLFTSNTRISLLGVLFLSAIPELSFWATGGLETSMYIFWLFIGIYAYIIEKRKDKPHLWSMIFISLMALTRPEGLFFGLAILLWDLANNLLIRNSGNKTSGNLWKNLMGIIVFGFCYGVYFLWRYNFYGFLFPNTFYAKRSGNTGQVIHRVVQISHFIEYLLPLVSFACFGYFYFRKESREKAFLTIVTVVLILFCFVSKNEWMPGFRYELPFVPLLILFFSIGIERVIFNNVIEVKPQWKTQVTTFCVLFCLGMYLIYPFNHLRKIGESHTEQLNRAHIPLGKWLKRNAPKDASYASWDMGAVPYYSELPNIIEINSEGLLNSYITHNGYDINYLLSFNPSFIALPPDNDITPETILAFYSNERFKSNYEFIFSFSFTKDYLLNVYKNRSVKVTSAALQEGKFLADKSKIEANKD